MQLGLAKGFFVVVAAPSDLFNFNKDSEEVS